MWGIDREGAGEVGVEAGVGDLRFSASIPIVVFILITRLEILRVFLLDLSVGHVVADSGIKFVESLPLELVPFLGEVASCSNGALEG